MGPRFFKGIYPKPLHILAPSPEVLTPRRWHQDVKPANILVLSRGLASPYEFQFKLADLGLSHFTSTVRLETDLVEKDTRGTRAYGGLL